MKALGVLAAILPLGLCGCGYPDDAVVAERQLIVGPEAQITVTTDIARRCGAADIRQRPGSVAFEARSDSSKACIGRWQKAEWEREHPFRTFIARWFS